MCYIHSMCMAEITDAHMLKINGRELKAATKMPYGLACTSNNILSLVQDDSLMLFATSVPFPILNTGSSISDAVVVKQRGENAYLAVD